MSVEAICGTILIAKDPSKLTQFYSRALDLDFETEEHDDHATHYGINLGHVHFGIHPASNFNHVPETRSSVIAFHVQDLDACVTRMREMSAEELNPPHQEGFGRTATYKDPEGNLVEVVELNFDFDE